MEPYTASAEYYDMIYDAKAGDMYDAAIRDILHFCNLILGKNPKLLLDIGCGTGTHASKLLDLGIDVIALDYSKDQLRVAEEKLRHYGDRIQIIHSDMAEMPIFDEKSEVGACFFSSFCYLLEEEKIIKFLDKASKNIENYGLLFLEFWNSIAIIENSKTFYEVEKDGTKLLRYNTTSYDPISGIVSMPMHHKIIKDNEVLADFTETHQLLTLTLPHFKSILKNTDWMIHTVYTSVDGERVDVGMKDLRYYVILVKK